MIDGQIISQLDLGRIETWGYYSPTCQPPGPYTGFHCAWLPGTATAVISGSARVGPGPHYVMIAITRAYPAVSADPAESPFFYQFLDHVTVTWTEADNR